MQKSYFHVLRHIKTTRQSCEQHSILKPHETVSIQSIAMRAIIYTWAKVLHIFKEAKRLGNVCENCRNYLYQHTTQAFCDISDKVLLLWFIAHWENDNDPWQHVTYQKVSCHLLVADTLNLAQQDYSSTFIVSMPPKRCQPFSMYVRWQNIGIRRSGLKQMEIVNHFDDGQSDVGRILSKHRQTGSAKDRSCLGGPKKQMHKRTGSWLGWQYITGPSPALSLPENWASSPHLTVQIHGQSLAICRTDSQQTAQKTSFTECQAQKGMCAMGPTA